MKYSTPLFLLSLLFCYSCKKELVPQDNPSGGVPATTENAVAPAGLTPATNVNATPAQAESQANGTVLAGINPAHGAPGHRCDIAVGAPLNAPTTKTATTTTPVKTVSTAPAPVVVKQNVTPVATKPGMNPPHGQTGHRCDIPVGSPLNSASANATKTPVASDAGNSDAKPQVPVLLNPDSATPVTN